MDLRDFGLDPGWLNFLLDHIDFYDEADSKSHHAPSRAYVRDSKAMASTQADILDYPNAYKFVVDMPGLKSEKINVQMEDNMLVVSGERKRDKDKEQKEGVNLPYYEIFYFRNIFLFLLMVIFVLLENYLIKITTKYLILYI